MFEAGVFGVQRVWRLWLEMRLDELVDVRLRGFGGFVQDFDFLLIVVESRGRVFRGGIYFKYRVESLLEWKQVVGLEVMQLWFKESMVVIWIKIVVVEMDVGIYFIGIRY